MTIGVVDRAISYTTTGASLGPFSIPFQFFEIEVYVDGSLINSTLYVISWTDETEGSTGSITFIPGHKPDGELRIIGVTSRTQQTEYQQNSAFPASSHEKALDRLTMLIQELYDRSITLPPASAGIVDSVLPSPEAGTILSWNEDEDALVNASLAALTSEASAAAIAEFIAIATAALEAAEAAADASGVVHFYDTKADANTGLAGLTNGDVVEVFVDESRHNRRTRYRKVAGVYVFKLYMGPPLVIDVMEYGAVGDGVTNDAANIALAAVAAAASGAVGTLLFTSGTYFINTDLTLDETITVEFVGDASLLVAAGKTVTINGPIKAGTVQIFDSASTGHIEGSDLNGEVHAIWFGISPDNSSADNGAGLMRMGWFLRQTRGAKIVHFDRVSAGTYDFNRTEWSKGIANLTLHGYGATMHNALPTGGNFAAHWGFAGNFHFFTDQDYETAFGGAINFFYGHKFESVDVGSDTITTQVAGEAANYAPGDTVLLYGWGTQQNSFPPNPRYFEWHTVVSANAGTGVITLANNLNYSYDERWYDFSSASECGIPRIINLTRDEFSYGDYLEINDLEFTSAADANGDVYVSGYKRAVLRRVKTLASVPTTSQHVEYVDCDIHQVETDKILETVTFSGCKINRHLAGTGCNVLTFNKGTTVRELLQSAARMTIVDDAVITSNDGNGNMIGGWTWAPAQIVSRRCRFAPTAFPAALLNGGAECSFTVDSVVDGTKVLIAFDGTDNEAEPLFQQLAKGVTYALDDGTKRVKITNIYQEDATNIAIEGEFSELPIAAEVYHGSIIQSAILEQPEVQEPDDVPGSFIQDVGNPSAGVTVSPRYGRHFHVALSEADIPRPASEGHIEGPYASQFAVRARLMRIWMFVDTAYTGTDASCTLVLQDGGVGLQTFDLKTAGVREVTAFDVFGDVGADALAATDGAYVYHLFPIIYGESAGFFPAYTDPLELPKFRIVMEFVQA